MNCLNVVAARRDHLEGDGLVSIQCDNTSEFQLHTDDTVWAAADMLESASLPSAPSILATLAADVSVGASFWLRAVASRSRTSGAG